MKRSADITLAFYPDGAQEHAIASHGIHRTVDLLLMMAYHQPGRHSTHRFASQVIASPPSHHRQKEDWFLSVFRVCEPFLSRSVGVVTLSCSPSALLATETLN